MRFILVLLCLIAATGNSASAASKITYYSDGALFQQDAGAVGGVIEIPLAAGVLENTLTIVPAPGTTILDVYEHKIETASRSGKEFEAMTEQRRRLEDRLQALETREAIFTSAAKAQSGKAPRKTKSNPDPMQAIRQGTDFAIAQLEAVYTARRKTTQEIRKIDARLAAAGKNGRQTDSSVRITVSPSRGKVTFRYATAERGWEPEYKMQLEGDGTARLRLSARVTGSGRGQQVHVSPGSLSDGSAADTVPAQSGSVVLASYLVAISEKREQGGIFNSFYGMVTNNSPQYLPPGDSRLYRSGTYMGKFRFDGLSSGRSKAVSLGK